MFPIDRWQKTVSTLVKSLFFSLPTPFDELQTHTKHALDAQKIYWGKHLKDKEEGSRSGQGESLAHDVGRTSVTGETAGSRIGWEEPQTTVQASESVSQASEESTSKHCLLEESHIRQKKPGSSASAVLRCWLGRAQGKRGLGTFRHEKSNSCHQMSSPQ